VESVCTLATHRVFLTAIRPAVFDESRPRIPVLVRGPPLSCLVEYGPLSQKISSQALGSELLFFLISLWTGFPIYLSFDTFVDGD